MVFGVYATPNRKVVKTQVAASNTSSNKETHAPDTAQVVKAIQAVSDNTVLKHKVDLAHPPEQAEWIDEPFIARGAVTVIAGREGEGKSLIEEDDAIKLAAAGYKVLIVDVENGARLIAERLHKLGMGYDDPKIVERIAVYTPQGFDFSSEDADDFMAFQEMIELEKPDVVFIDSLRSIYGQSLASRKIGILMELFRMVAKHHNLGMVIIHHTTKSGNTYLGSGAIGSVVEMVYYMLRAKDDPDSDRRYITCYKNRLTREPDDIWLRISSEADANVLAIEPCDPFIPPPTKVQNALTNRILAYLITGERAKGAYLNLKDICEYIHRDPKDRTVRRILDSLVEQGLVLKEKNSNGRVVYAVVDSIRDTQLEMDSDRYEVITE